MLQEPSEMPLAVIPFLISFHVTVLFETQVPSEVTVGQLNESIASLPGSPPPI